MSVFREPKPALSQCTGKFTIKVFDRLYDHHRPRGCTVLAIEYADWPGNEFGLWLPESVFIKDGEAYWGNWRHDLGDVHQDWEIDMQGRFTWELTREDFTLTSTLTIDEEHSCLWYRHTFSNKSDKPLLKLSTQNCFHLVNAPQFISIKGERLWACLDGQWISTDRVPRHESPDPRRVTFQREGTRNERTVVRYTKGFQYAIMPEAACHPLFIAENFDATASVGIASSDFRHLFNNNDFILRCIHSAPHSIDALPPGESADQESVILFCNGDHRAIYEQFEQLRPDHWVGY